MLRVLIAAAFVCLAGCSGAPDKTQPTPLKRISEEIKLVKIDSVSLGGNDSTGLTPDAFKDAVAASSSDGEVTLFDAKLNTRWTTDLDVNILAGVALNQEAVYVVTADANLVALSIKDGSLLFSKLLPSISTGPPVADANRVYVKTQIGQLLVLDAKSGELAWIEEARESSIGIRGSAPMTLKDNTLFVLWESGRLVAYLADSGRTLWERQVAVPRGRSPLDRIVDSKGAPSVRNNMVAVATRNGQISLLNAMNGRPIWSLNSDAFPGALIAFNLVIVVETDGVVSAYSLQSGNLVWSSEKLKYRELSSPAILGDSIAVVDFEGELHLLSPKDGRMLGRLDVGSAQGKVAPVTFNTGVLVQLTDGRLVHVGVVR
jgi:outer membrane protein assembly factor BamB